MRAAFEKALKQNPLDHETRMVFADFLEENDRPEEANRERAKIIGYKTLQEIADFMNDGPRKSWERYKTKYPDEYSDLPYEEESDRAVTVEVLIEAGEAMVAGKVFCFTRDEDVETLPQKIDEFWEAWSKVTGKEAPAKSDDDSWSSPRRSFRCAC